MYYSTRCQLLLFLIKIYNINYNKINNILLNTVKKIFFDRETLILVYDK